MKASSFFTSACEEPFRIFFPLGLLAGISGVLLWPLHFAGIHQFYPGVMHARLMVEGFLAAFIFGFLGTAGPRLTGTHPFSAREFTAALTLYGVTLASHIAQYTALGDLLFLTLLLAMVALLGRRFRSAKHLPPPGFVLVGIGFLSAIAGALLLTMGESGLIAASWIIFGGTLLNEVWVLLLVLGVGSFLLPRFLNLPPRTTGLHSPSRWRRGALMAAATGATLVALYAMETVVEAPRLIASARFVIATTYFFAQVRLYQPPPITITRCLYLAMLLLLLGLLFPLGWPFQRVAGLHVIFIGGFSLITLTVATRVVLGHGGFSHLFARPLPFLSATALFFLSSTALRSGGDFALPWRGGALTLAGLLWIAGSVIWGVSVLPKIRCIEAEPPECPEKP